MQQYKNDRDTQKFRWLFEKSMYNTKALKPKSFFIINLDYYRKQYISFIANN